MHLKAVADETAKASFDMVNCVVTRASQLSRGGTGGKSKQQMHRPLSTYSATSASDTDFISDGETTFTRSETTRGRQMTTTFGAVNHLVNLPSNHPLQSSCLIFQFQVAIKMTLGLRENLVNETALAHKL